jgi:tetratricopeptide (TPR) repeat protein
VKAAVAATAGLLLAIPGAVAADLTTSSVGYICSAEQHVAHPGGQLTIAPGYGVGGFPVGTQTPEAQRWFNFGVVLFHAFYHDDAKTAFDKAVAADPNCSLCLWGQALSRGPTQNFDVSADQIKTAAAIAAKAQAAARTPLEHQLADAMAARYAAPQDARTEIDFAHAVLRAAALEPANTDLPLIATEAMLTAWRRGDKTQAALALPIIEPILKREPDNTAAIHYYIHATEMAGTPALALPYATRLAALAPKASHLIHMASHTYLHVGQYEDAAAVNAEALDVDTVHAADTGAAPGPLGKPFYYAHNYSLGLEGAMMAGDGRLALKYADHAPIAFPAKGGEANWPYLIGRSFVAYGRFDPNRALALPEPAKGDAYRSGMWLYGRGEAYASKGDAKDALAQSQLMGAALGTAPNLADDRTAQLQIGRRVLEGRAAMLEGRPDDAAKSFAEAAAIQDKAKWHFDPPPWWYPLHRSVAAADLKAGRNAEAVTEANISLAVWPSDALALRVLSLAEAKLGQTKAADADMAKARRAWRGDLAKVSVDLT